MVTAIQKTDTFFGEKKELQAFANRIKVMVPGGAVLKDNEAMALAQVSFITGLNPFIGEVWYISGRGPMVGIRGARRHGNEQIEQAGGKDAYWFPDFQVCDFDEAGAKDVKDVAAAFKCTITDSVSTAKYQAMLIETINTLRAAGSKDPVGEAREIVGKKPSWIGYGYATTGEQSRMNKTQLARKRAEADALKKRFYIPFGADISADETAAEAGDWIEASVAASEQVDTAFPPENENQDTNQVEPAIELIDPLGKWGVEFAAKHWNIDTKQAAQEIGKRKLGHRIEKVEFMHIVRGEAQPA